MASLNGNAAQWIMVIIAVSSLTFAIGTKNNNRLEARTDSLEVKIDSCKEKISKVEMDSVRHWTLIEAQLEAMRAILTEIKEKID